jgi:hypothetical protein
MDKPMLSVLGVYLQESTTRTESCGVILWVCSLGARVTKLFSSFEKITSRWLPLSIVGVLGIMCAPSLTSEEKGHRASRQWPCVQMDMQTVSAWACAMVLCMQPPIDVHCHASAADYPAIYRAYLSATVNLL